MLPSAPAEMPGEVIFGRDSVLEFIDRFLDESKSGGAACTLLGEAGVGKTRLLIEAISRAGEAGMTVLSAAGVEYEVDITYAGLNQLLLPIVDHLGAIPSQLGEALTVALGLGDGEAPSPLLVCNATLALTSQAAGSKPILLAVDDVQWLDPASKLVLRLIAHRAIGNHIGLLTTLRSSGTSNDEFGSIRSTIKIEPLLDEDAELLVLHRHPDLSASVRQRLLSEATGNPLALVELADIADRLSKASGDLPPILPMSWRLSAAFAGRIADLPPDTRSALLLLALEGTSSVRSLGELGVELSVLMPAEQANMISVEAESNLVAFRHPLTRSAVVNGANSEERRRAHTVLAQRSGTDPDRRAWHFAEAAQGPDEDIAQQMEIVARRALSRGDAAAAIAALGRAARLSPDGQELGRRLAEAAYLGADLTGERDASLRLLTEARRLSADQNLSLHAVAAEAYVRVESDGDVDSAIRLIVAALDAVDHGWDANDAALLAALSTLLVLLSWSGRSDLWQRFEEYLERLQPGAPDVLEVETRTYGNTVYEGGGERSRLIALIAQQADETDPGRAFRVNTSAVYMDLLGPCRESAHRLYDQGLQIGAVRVSIVASIHLCLEAFMAGRLDEADLVAERAIDLCKMHGYDFTIWYFLLQRGLVAGLKGDTAEAFSWADQHTMVAATRNAFAVERIANHTRTLAAASAGDWESAFRFASSLSPAGEFLPFNPHAMWVAFDLVEAAVRTGRLEQARSHVEAMASVDLKSVSPRMALLSVGAAALVAEGDSAFDLFDEALSVPGIEAWPFDVARVRLGYGEKLRRSFEALRAREHLRVSLELFERIGSTPWATRAREELRASGDAEVAHSSDPSQSFLTPQERAIAELAASGMSNKDIAARLYIAPRTVAGHLYRLFPKLGVTSRAGLRDAMNPDRSI